MKRNPRKTLKNKLDKAWSKAVRIKYPRCVVCGGEPTQAHHAIARKAQSLGVRWILENGIGLCYCCHIFKLHGPQGDKAWLDRYIKILNDLIPAEVQQKIFEIGHRINKYSIDEMEEILKQLKGEF